LAEEAKRSRYIGSEPSNPSPIQPLAPQPVRANHVESIATRSKLPTGRPGLPGGWDTAPGSPPPTITPSAPEEPANELPTTNPPIMPPTPEPTYPIGNALQNLKRKLVSHMPSSEIVRSSPSPQGSQYVLSFFFGKESPPTLSCKERATSDTSK
jgi:hypothetical protein